MSENSATWQTHQFIIPENQLLECIRLFPHENDGILNFFEVVRFMDAETAGIIRILTRGVDMTLYKLENLFKMMLPEFLWHFKLITTKPQDRSRTVSLDNLTKEFNELRPNHLVLGVAESLDPNAGLTFFTVFRLGDEFYFMCPTQQQTFPLRDIYTAFHDTKSIWILSSIRIIPEFYASYPSNSPSPPASPAYSDSSAEMSLDNYRI